MKRSTSILFAGVLASGLLYSAIGQAQQPAEQQVAPAPAEKPAAVIPPPPAEAATPTPTPAEKLPAAAPKQEPTAPPAAAATPPAQPPHPSPIGPNAAPSAPTENTPPPQPIPTTPPDPNDNFPALRTGSSHDQPPTDVATSPLPPFEGEGGHAAAGHGAAHHGPFIQNWWSWNYGPGTPYEHPPFGFALINFAVFLAILARLFGKSFGDFLRNRHNEIKRALDRAREVQQNAEKHLRQLEDRSRNLESEIAELLANYRRLAESERAAIVQRAEAEAQSLLKDAESQAHAAIANAKRELEKQTALLAVDLAEKIIKSRLTDDDQKRMTEQYITQVEGLSRKSPHAGSSASPTGAVKGNPS